MIKTVIKEDQTGKKLLSRPRIRSENCVKRDVKTVDPGANCREAVDNSERDGRRDLFYGMVLKYP